MVNHHSINSEMWKWCRISLHIVLKSFFRSRRNSIIILVIHQTCQINNIKLLMSFLLRGFAVMELNSHFKLFSLGRLLPLHNEYKMERRWCPRVAKQNILIIHFSENKLGKDWRRDYIMKQRIIWYINLFKNAIS